MAKAYLGKGRERRVHRGHPWVFRSDIDRVEGPFSPGDDVAVHSSHGTFLGRAMYNPASQIALRLFTRHDEPIDEAFIRGRVMRAIEYRRSFADLRSCRVLFAESDGLPALIADSFGDTIVIQSLALGMERWKDTVVQALDEALSPRGIWERSDAKVRELEGMEQTQGLLRGAVPDQVEMEENGIRFLVDVKRGQKTGYFLDQKENRAAIAPFVKGARVLDCFTHTGSFALHAAHYGAAEVTAVDISALALAQAGENAAINGLALRTEEANAFDLLRAKQDAGETYDVIILDPPAFAKSRATVTSALRGYKEINLRAMKMVRDGGFLVTCSCSHHVLPDLFSEMLVSAGANAKVTLRQVEARTQGRDHPILAASPETQYLKCHILQVYRD